MSNKAQKTRDYQFDNLKFILITLVVMAHFVSPLITESPAINALNTVIYAFHMPMFVFVSGYFAKSYISDNKKRIQSTLKMLTLYIIFQTIYYFFYNFVLGKPTDFTLINPYWSLWYLMAMAIWIFTLPYLIKIKYPLVFTFIVGLLGAVGQILGGFALPRVLGFLFYFILGATFDKRRFEEKVKNIPRLIPTAVLAIIILFLIKFAPQINKEWFMMNKSFHELGVTNIEGFVILTLVYLTAISIMFCLYFVIPKEEAVISQFGARTLVVYLFHGFFIKLFTKFGGFVGIDTPYEVFSILMLAIILTLLLATDTFSRLTSWLVNPPIDRWVSRIVN